MRHFIGRNPTKSSCEPDGTDSVFHVLKHLVLRLWQIPAERREAGGLKSVAFILPFMQMDVPLRPIYTSNNI